MYVTISQCLPKVNENQLLAFTSLRTSVYDTNYNILSFYDILVNPNQVRNKMSLFPSTLDDDGFQVVLNKKRKRDMWREYEKKLHMKLISIGKSLAEDDMMDSDTTGK